MSDPRVAVSVSPRPWADRLVRFAADHGGVEVRLRPLTTADALAGDYRVLLLDDTTSFLTARLVDDLLRSGRQVIGVFDPDEDPDGKRHLLELGVTTMLEASADSAEFIAAVVATAGATPSPPSTPDEAGDTLVSGRTVAVLGAGGGVGATEIAIEVARRLARGRHHPILVDLNPVRPAVAARLDLPLHPNLRTAIDAAVHRSGPLSRAVLEGPSRGFEVVGGLPEPRTWAEVRASDVGHLLDDLAGLRDVVVVDAGCDFEPLRMASGPGRFDLARTALSAADDVILVAAPTPVGVIRALDVVAELRDARRAPPVIVVNRVGGSRFVRAEIRREFGRTAPSSTVVMVPADRRVLEAGWRGLPVVSGPFTRAVRTVVSRLQMVAV